jgi:hypothetical protein
MYAFDQYHDIILIKDMYKSIMTQSGMKFTISMQQNF